VKRGATKKYVYRLWEGGNFDCSRLDNRDHVPIATHFVTRHIGTNKCFVHNKTLEMFTVHTSKQDLEYECMVKPGQGVDSLAVRFDNRVNPTFHKSVASYVNIEAAFSSYLDNSAPCWLGFNKGPSPLRRIGFPIDKTKCMLECYVDPKCALSMKVMTIVLKIS